MLTSKVPEVHETQNGAERRGKILPWDVVGRGGGGGCQLDLLKIYVRIPVDSI